MPILHAYLHGFNSSPNSCKGQLLNKVYLDRGITLLRPDLRKPSFAKQSISHSLNALDQLHLEISSEEISKQDKRHCDSVKWRIIGSSLGAYTAARWAQLHPERVDRLILLAPSFNFAQLIPQLVGENEYEQWQKNGSLDLPDGEGEGSTQALDWNFVVDATQHPAVPLASCSCKIIHGLRDEAINISEIRKSVTQLAHAELIEVDDDHSLMNSVNRITGLVEVFFEIGLALASKANLQIDSNSVPSATTNHNLEKCTFHWDFFGPTATRTAEHFVHHLNDFLQKLSMPNYQTGVSNTHTAHAEAWCEVTINYEAAIVEALRPHRKTGSRPDN